MINSPSDQPGGGRDARPTGEAAAIIAEIRAIYRDHHHQPRGRSLEEFSAAQLTAHLAQLQAGAYPWMRARPRSPRVDAE